MTAKDRNKPFDLATPVTRGPVIAAVLVTFLTACSPSQPPQAATDAGDAGGALVQPQQTPTGTALPQDAVPQRVIQPVDWEAAVQAAAANPPGTDPVIQPMAAGDTPPAVPILVPTGLVTAQGESVSFQSTADGYFAVFPGPVFDVIVNGTAEALAGTAPETGERPEMLATATEQGLQIALTRFGADYLFEFECKGGNPNCITEAEAQDVVARLAVLGR